MKGIFAFLGVLALIGLGVLSYYRLSDEGQSELYIGTEESSQEAIDDFSTEADFSDDQDEGAGEDLKANEVQTSDQREQEGIEVKEDEVYFPRFDQLTEAELDELEEFYDQADENWTRKMRELIIDELNLSESVYEEYESLRDDFEDARWAAFEDFHERLFEKEGEDYSYRMSEYHEEIELPLAESYRQRLVDILGEENFKRYLEVKDEFNEELRGMQDPRRGIILMHL